MKIKFDTNNYRIHNDANKELIKKSLLDCGTGRSVVVDADGEIISGNGVYEQAQKLGIPIKTVLSDGNKLFVVKRIDLKYDDEKRKKLAVMDNSTSDSSNFDRDLLEKDFAQEELVDLGVITLNDISEEIETELKQDSGVVSCPSCGYIGKEEEFIIKGK